MRNDVVFNGISPRISQAITLALEEAEFCQLAGLKGLSMLVAVRPAGQQV